MERGEAHTACPFFTTDALRSAFEATAAVRRGGRFDLRNVPKVVMDVASSTGLHFVTDMGYVPHHRDWVRMEVRVNVDLGKVGVDGEPQTEFVKAEIDVPAEAVNGILHVFRWGADVATDAVHGPGEHHITVTEDVDVGVDLTDDANG